MTIEHFAYLMSGIESLAIVIAAIWGIITFWARGERAKSKKDLQQAEYDLRKLEIEVRKLEQQTKIGAVVEISISARQCTLPNDSSRYVSAVVEIENKGIQDTRLEYEEARRPFQVYAVSVKDAGSLEFNQVAAQRVPVASSLQGSSPSVVVQAGGKEKIPFFFRLDSPGLYLLVFWAPASEEVQDALKELRLRHRANWVAKEYFVVE